MPKQEVALPFWAERALGVVGGLTMNVVLKIFATYALIETILTKVFGWHDPSLPRATHAHVTPLTISVKARAAATSDSDDSDDATDASEGGKDQEVAPDLAPKPSMVEVVHIPVDAVAGAKSEAWRLVGPYMRRYGSGALSSSTLWNPEFIHMFVPGMGSQPYVVGRAYWRTIVVGLGDPLANPAHWPEMIAAFKRAFPHATYAHVTPGFAQLLKDAGLQINDMGAETNVMVQKWAYNKKTRTIRMAARDARAAGVTVREITKDDLTPEVSKQLAHVTGDWVQQKSVADQMLRVFIRHADYDNLHLDEGVRLFVAESPVHDETAAPAAAADADESDGEGSTSSAPSTVRPAAPVRRRIDGFVLVDPLWKDGRVYGYVTSLNRMRRGCHHGVLKLLYEDLFAAAKAEGKDMVTFGFAPFFNLQTDKFQGPIWSEIALRFLFNFGNTLYQFKNLAFSKARYGGSVIGDSYKDPNVTMTHVYGAHISAHPGIGVLDQYVLMMYVGFLGDLDDTFWKLAGLRKSFANSFTDECGGARVAGAAGGDDE